MRIGICANYPILVGGMAVLLNSKTTTPWTVAELPLESGRCDVVLVSFVGNLVTAKEIVASAQEQDSAHHRTPVVIMTDQREVTQFVILSVLRYGVYGIVPLDADQEKVRTAIIAAASNNYFIDPGVCHLDWERLLKSAAGVLGHNETEDLLEGLTSREKEVFVYLAEGKVVKEIACILGIAPKTVEAHKFNLMGKLGIHNKAQLVRMALRLRVISLNSPTAPAAESTLVS